MSAPSRSRKSATTRTPSLSCRVVDVGAPAQRLLRARGGDALVVDLAGVVGVLQLLAMQRAQRGVDQRAVGDEHHAEKQAEQDDDRAAGQRPRKSVPRGNAALAMAPSELSSMTSIPSQHIGGNPLRPEEMVVDDDALAAREVGRLHRDRLRPRSRPSATRRGDVELRLQRRVGIDG